MLLFLFFYTIIFSQLSQLALSLNQEGLYLTRVKLSLSDPDGVFATWNDRDQNPCNWQGITCNAVSSVNAVSLPSSNIAGQFPPLLCRLQNLGFVSFYNNSINSTLPDEIGECRNLEHLNLAQNLITGNLPYSLSDLDKLKFLDLTGNNLSGDVPESFGSFQKLEVLSLVENLFDGVIPEFLGNISSLKQLNLSYNPFKPGRIPGQFGNLMNLEVLWTSDCNLVGEMPDSLSQLSKLVVLDFSVNGLEGRVPSWITGLTRVVQIELYNNSFSGVLPTDGWGNMSALRLFDVSMNELNGSIPVGLCSLSLESLNLYENKLEGTLPDVIAESVNLYELKLFGNRLTGEIPKDLGKNSPLILVDLSENQLTGGIPASLCEKGVLEEVLVIYNSLSGEIPASLGECRSLTRVRLAYNKLSGAIPASIWGLPSITLLEFLSNSFSGEIAKTIAGAISLSSLIISKNNFSGGIPEELGWLENLMEFSGSNNQFSGSLPSSIVKLEQVGTIDLHNNKLSGELPAEIHSLKKLNELNLAGNQLSGKIPEEIGRLSDLNYLDLSNNQFSGKIPSGLQNLKLNQLNLSNNHLSGDIPASYAKEIYLNSFKGNPGLCKGGINGLCDGTKEPKSAGYVWLLRSIFVLAGIVLILGLFWFYRKYKNFKKTKIIIEKSKWTLMSFHKLGFSEYEILDSLDEDNVIGAGASGKVYKVDLSTGESVAVKKLWTTSKMAEENNKQDGFDAEVETLGKIRHKNIVRLWCCCKTKDCKLLVYEYMPNGSLGDLLHGNKSGLLDWPIRFRIAMDSAEGLSYLHHDCVPAIVHRDVKSNNILLDGDFGARVSDFGVAKTVDAIGKGGKSMSVIAGSCGYIAPEYAYTLRVNEKSDIYSFGVVILELVTGRLPVDPEFGEKDLVKWVCTTLDQKGFDQVVDSKLDTCFNDEINKVLNIGLLCTSPLPINRPSMRRVVKMLLEIGSETHLKIPKKDGKLSPYYYEDASDNGSVSRE